MNKEDIQNKIEQIALNGATDGCNMAYIERESEKLAEEIVKNCSIQNVSVSPFSGEVINEAAKKWSESRSVGDTYQDRNYYYDFRKGMEAMFRLIQDSR